VSVIRENGLLKPVSEQNGFSPGKSSRSGSAKKANGDVSPRKRKHLMPTDLSKKFSSSSKKGLKRTRDELSDTDSDMPLAELQNCISDDDDDDIVLAKLNKAAKKLKKSKGLENRATKAKLPAKQRSHAKLNGAVIVDDDDDDVALAVIKQKKAEAKQQNKGVKRSVSTASPKKKVDVLL